MEAACRREGRLVNPGAVAGTVLWEPGLDVRVPCPAIEGREVREAAGCVADGPVEVLVAVDSLALLGAAVDVRGAPEIDVRVEGVESCFVGDFVGDYNEH